VLAWGLVALAAPAGAAPLEETPVAVVSVEGDVVDPQATLEVLGIEVGAPLDRSRLRDTILAMYASTETEWIRIEASEGPEGLEVVVRISHRPTVERVHVEVAGRLLRKRVEKWLEIGPGDAVSAAAAEAGKRRIARRLRELGHPDPRVDVFLDYRRSTNTVEVTVAVDLGAPTTVGSVVLRGVEDPELAAAVTPELGPGKKLTTGLQDKLRQRVEHGLKSAGYWEAEVLGIVPSGSGGPVEVEISVAPGERFRLELEAPPDSSKAVLEAIPDPAREEIHPHQTAALAERVRERLQEAGYLLAEVTAELVTDEAGPLLRLRVEPGAVRRVASIEFPGATSLSQKRLEERVTVRSGAVRGLRGQDVSARSLERDRLSLIDLLRSRGFPEGTVGTPRIEPVGDDAVRIVFPIDEGQRWTVTDLRLEGFPAETAAALETAELPIQLASPWDPRQVEAARHRLEALLGDTGYPDGRVSAEIDASRLGEAEIVFTAEPGGFVRFGTVVIAGLRRTRESVVGRTLRRTGVEPGAPYSRARLLEAQHQLYELALFRRVELVPMPGQERHEDRGIVVLLEEGLHKSYLVGLGWNETDRFRVTLGWYHLNLFGGAHAFSAETQLSSREERFQLGLREPRLPWVDLPAYLVVYRTYEEFATYAQRRRGLWIDVGDRLKRPYRSWWRYEYQIVQPENVSGDIGREEEEARISSITPTFEWDYRDNPLVPSRGTYSEISLDYAFPLFQADAEFLKLRARTTLYGDIANGRGAIGIRLGAIRPLGPGDDLAPNLQIPLNTRFFAGGANTHRAFARDFLGIPGQTIDDDGNPIGGNALVLVNAEYVRKISSLFSGHVFVDAGNVWESPSAVRFEDVRWGAGLGFSLDTPAGPIRLEYGFKLDREPGESTGQWWLSFGIPF
jgi:outer membrane protein insertion porin family